MISQLIPTCVFNGCGSFELIFKNILKVIIRCFIKFEVVNYQVTRLDDYFRWRNQTCDLKGSPELLLLTFLCY